MSSANKKRPLRDELRERVEAAKHRIDEAQKQKLIDENRIKEDSKTILTKLSSAIIEWIDENAKEYADENHELAQYCLGFRRSYLPIKNVTQYEIVVMGPGVTSRNFSLSNVGAKNLWTDLEYSYSYLIGLLAQNYQEMFFYDDKCSGPDDKQFELSWK